MQFLKTISSNSVGKANLALNNGQGKYNIEMYIKKLFFIPYLHDSKVGLLNSLIELSSYELSNEVKTEINNLDTGNTISNNLRNLFRGINDFKFQITQAEKDELDGLLRYELISQQLRNTCLAVYDPNELIADIAASQIQMLFEKGHLKSSMIRECLKCCRDLVFNMGYKQLHTASHITFEDDEFKTIVNNPSNNTKNVMILPGCQTEGMLSARILKAVQLLKYFPDDNLIIIASGGNPLGNSKNPPNSITIGKEAETIFQFLNEFVGKLNIKFSDKWDQKIESDSDNSVANVINSIKNEKYMKRTESHNLIIVSSSFHLMKLSRIIEEEVNIISKEYPNFISNIILFGSEKVEDDFSPEKRGGYIKSMFVEVYKELLTIHNNSSNGISR